MLRRFLISLVYTMLTLTSAMAQAPCLTLSENLRCFNEPNDSVTTAAVISDAAVVLSYLPARTAAAKCDRSASVFVDRGENTPCEQ